MGDDASHGSHSAPGSCSARDTFSTGPGAQRAPRSSPSDERVLHCLKHTAKSPDLVAKRLLQEALDRGTDDNTSVVVVFLQPL